MRAVIQRSNNAAEVRVNNKVVGAIPKGLIVYLGIESNDTEEDIQWLANKICKMRIFNDEEAKMNLSLLDIGGEILIISQFTLFASTKKGNRPSYLRSAKPEFAEAMYDKMIGYISNVLQVNVATGIFGADMKVDYINDGPVTIIVDTKDKE